MICDDCKDAADYEALPGLVKVIGMGAGGVPLGDHETCRQREALATVNLQIETNHGTIRANTCTCQHRVQRVKSH